MDLLKQIFFSCTSVSQFVTPPVAASCAIIPVYYGFIAKSALQLGQPRPKLTLKNSLLEGIKASPVVGATVGSQLLLQNVFDQRLFGEKKNSFSSTLISAGLVAFISCPLLAIFNGRTLGYTAKESLKQTSSKQVTAIIARETSFIFSLKVSHPLKDYMKTKQIDSLACDVFATFLSGALGSAFGHPADTALTLWQKKMPINSCSILTRGLMTKSIAVGGFSVFYNFFEQIQIENTR